MIQNRFVLFAISDTYILKTLLWRERYLRMTTEERTIAENYAKLHGINIAEAFKRALFEHIEDEYDLKLFEEYEADKAKGNVKTYSHEEVWKEFDL